MNGYLEFSDPPEYLTYPLVFPVKDWPKKNDPSFIGIFFSKCRIGKIREMDIDQRKAGVYFRYYARPISVLSLSLERSRRLTKRMIIPQTRAGPGRQNRSVRRGDARARNVGYSSGNRRRRFLRAQARHDSHLEEHVVHRWHQSVPPKDQHVPAGPSYRRGFHLRYLQLPQLAVDEPHRGGW